MAQVLKKELETYERERESMLASHKGEFVLIYKDEVIGFFPTEDEAIDEGYRKFGYVALLVKEVTEVDEPWIWICHPVSG